MTARKPLVVVSGTVRDLSSGDTLEGKEFVFAASNTGTSPLVIGAVYLFSGTSYGTESRAYLGTAAGGTATIQLRRVGTGTLLSGASWGVTGDLADVSGSSFSVEDTDWYTIELVGDDAPTISLAYGLSLVP